MCGIVGYVGTEQAAPILLAGLSKLEYRGYDSAGIAIRNEDTGDITVVKAKGRLKILSEKTNDGRCSTGNVWYRPYTLGNARRTIGEQCTSALHG